MRAAVKVPRLEVARREKVCRVFLGPGALNGFVKALWLMYAKQGQEKEGGGGRTTPPEHHFLSPSRHFDGSFGIAQ